MPYPMKLWNIYQFISSFQFKMGEAIKENKTFIVPDEVYKYPYELKSLKYLKVRHVTIENY